VIQNVMASKEKEVCSGDGGFTVLSKTVERTACGESKNNSKEEGEVEEERGETAKESGPPLLIWLTKKEV